MDTSVLDKAIVFAVKAHAGTGRRGKGFPYIVHPMETVEIVATMTDDQELMAAAALHDTVEDTSVTLDDISREFGPRVAKLVEEESDVFMEGVSESDSWHSRKQAALTAWQGPVAMQRLWRLAISSAMQELFIVILSKKAMNSGKFST